MTSKQIGKLQRSTGESTMEKPVKKKEHRKNGSASCSASCYTIMKHITDETKTFENLDAAWAAKVISYENSFIKMHNYANYELFKSITQ